MPIPDFDHNYVLPPHIGNPANINDVSPYPISTLEFVQKFSTSKTRIDILHKFLDFRTQTRNAGLINGFQWLDGSFVENIEISEGRNPRDLDLITIFWGYDPNFLKNFHSNFSSFFDPNLAKTIYNLDHYNINLNNIITNPEFVTEYIRYWVQLFSHNRRNVWKGMLKIQLNTPQDDTHALNYLNSI